MTSDHLHEPLRRLFSFLAHLGWQVTPRAIIEQVSQMQMIDVHLPTTDSRTILLSRYTQPNRDPALLLAKLGLDLPAQPPPRITANKQLVM